MCKNMTILAKENAARYIAQCEHRTIHLVWDSLSIRLCPAGFLRLANHICTRTATLIEQDEGKGIGLKLHTIGVRFPPETLATLSDLMNLAALQMEKSTGALNESPDELVRTTGTFSLN